ncbi:hypothetical protein EC968_009091 [Mortierella alpina]|nr:hypothetical protein EC968_009091 [Mortierella alpina]
MSTAAPLRVLIVGADIATLTLALILEQAGIDYLLLEGQTSVPVVAGGISLHPTVLPFMEQLALRDDLFFNSQPLEQVLVLDPDMETITSYDWSNRQTRYSAWTRFMTRPEYCDMIVQKLPESKILFNKTLTSLTTVEADDEHEEDFDVYIRRRQDSILDDDILDEEEKEKNEAVRGVTVKCADGSVYHGHILIGDVNSGIQDLVREDCHDEQVPSVAAEGKETPIREIQYHVSGVTEALDPQRIPLLREDTTQLRVVVDDKSPYSWWAATLVDNRIAWQVTKRMFVSEKSSRLSENFDPALLHEEQIVPIVGEAADDSILDALALSEALFSLVSARKHDVQTAFAQYHKDRTSRRMSSLDEARELDLLLRAKSTMRKLYRAWMLNYASKCSQEKRNDEKYSYRPQASFLQRVPDYGVVQPSFTSSGFKYTLVAVVGLIAWSRIDEHLTSQGEEKHPFTRYIEYYMRSEEESNRINEKHIALAQKAAEDAQFFAGAIRPPKVQLRYPDLMSNASGKCISVGTVVSTDDVVPKFH